MSDASGPAETIDLPKDHYLLFFAQNLRVKSSRRILLAISARPGSGFTPPSNTNTSFSSQYEGEPDASSKRDPGYPASTRLTIRYAIIYRRIERSARSYSINISIKKHISFTSDYYEPPISAVCFFSLGASHLKSYLYI